MKINGKTNKGSVDAGAEGTNKLVDVKNPLDAGFNTGGLTVYGTNGNDSFNVTLANKQWMGIRGRGGNDEINIKGNGLVRLEYHDLSGPINANLAKGRIDKGSSTDKIKGKVWEVRATNSNDTLNGSKHNESFITRAGNDKVNGKGGTDRLNYDRADPTIQIDADLQKGVVNKVWNGINYKDSVKGIENIRGSDRSDIIKGNKADNYFDGELGNDILEGRDGNDRLFGDNGSDTLKGQDGDDTLIGGAGKDCFVFFDEDDVDTIKDFEDNVDTLKIFGKGSKKQVLKAASDVGGDVVFDFGDGDMIIVENMSKADIANDLAVF